MSSVGQKNTGPEMLLRAAPHKKGLRYRLHDRSLPGSPDLIFPKYRAVVFVHGCYWHRHGCYRTTMPKTRKEFWIKKFEDNKARDRRSMGSLVDLGWRVLLVWECALVGKTSLSIEDVINKVNSWLQGEDLLGEIGGEAMDKVD